MGIVSPIKVDAKKKRALVEKLTALAERYEALSTTNKEEFIASLRKTPPVKCEFRVGDVVTLTNYFGIKFTGLKVVGFADNTEFYGRFIHLDGGDSWSFPERPTDLVLERREGEGNRV